MMNVIDVLTEGNEIDYSLIERELNKEIADKVMELSQLLATDILEAARIEFTSSRTITFIYLVGSFDSLAIECMKIYGGTEMEYARHSKIINFSVNRLSEIMNERGIK